MRHNFILLLRFAGALASVAVLVGFANRWHPAADSFVHFRLHLALVLLVVSVLAFVLRDRLVSLAQLVVAILGFSTLSPAFPPVLLTQFAADDHVTLMQFNIRYSNRTGQPIIDYIKSEDVDIITIQEMHPLTDKGLLHWLREHFPHHIDCKSSRSFNVAVFSRLPFDGDQSTACEGKTGQFAWVRLRKGSSVFTVANVHLFWPWPYGQWNDVDRLSQKLRNLTGPIILAGDFNAVPWSKTVERLAMASKTEVIAGLRFTYFRYVTKRIGILGLPIDHVLIPKGASAKVRLGPDLGSDHLPVIATIGLPRN
ncbi:MAG: endonuclease/exonuclease/phosphatase family protein [Pseudomonadota bacterium]